MLNTKYSILGAMKISTYDSTILDELNEKQKEAASITDGPVLILAGAGSGKTKTLTHRIAYLVEQGIKSSKTPPVKIIINVSN